MAIADGCLPEPIPYEWKPATPQAEKWRGKIGALGKDMWGIIREKAREVCLKRGWELTPERIKTPGTK